ncbi:uncharacterized protein EV154DRAFT_556930 [Mucor mucedo]|uniref:uncharacterized protein n=1 Tax=Mucor mucedo TaxID=29922 RepID=UPI00221FCF01|nr:uncharacterized protein EV154DRAFT_556930 [Mucor mucedo]KAI7867770.1 hypothetical protein EV154DRAFT_556930 [Mucor mucedo]
MSIASILPGRISTSVKGGRRLWREQGITQYSSQLCWLIECLNTCGHLGLKKRRKLIDPVDYILEPRRRRKLPVGCIYALVIATPNLRSSLGEYSLTIRLLLQNMCIGTHDEENRVPRP